MDNISNKFREAYSGISKSRSANLVNASILLKKMVDDAEDFRGSLSIHEENDWLAGVMEEVIVKLEKIKQKVEKHDN